MGVLFYYGFNLVAVSVTRLVNPMKYVNIILFKFHMFILTKNIHIIKFPFLGNNSTNYMR